MSIQKKFVCDLCQQVITGVGITLQGNLHYLDPDNSEGCGETVAGIDLTGEGINHYHQHCLVNKLLERSNKTKRDALYMLTEEDKKEVRPQSFTDDIETIEIGRNNRHIGS